MMSLETIESMDRDAAAKAAREKREPFALFSVDTVADDVRHAPHLGDYKPKSWRRATSKDVGLTTDEHGVYGDEKALRLFVDSSGMGSPGESALTHGELTTLLQRAVKHAGAKKLTVGVGLSNIGQFQVHIDLYVRRALRPARKGQVLQ